MSLFSSTAQARSFIVSNNSDLAQTFLIVNGSTGYIGINMGNPLYPLDISGSLRWSGNLTGGAVPWARLTEFPDSCPAGEAIQSIGGTITCIKLNSTSGNASGSGTSNYTAKFLSENVIGNSIIYDDGTNIGIGTANPQNKLNVLGGINATGNVYGMAGLCIGTDCKAAWSEVASPWDNSTTQIFNRAGYPLLINASNTLFVDGASGKVGVGTVNPTSALDVVGTLNVTDITLRTNCDNGQILKWSGGVGTCGTDNGLGSEADTLQNVTDRGNYTLNSIIIGASATPVKKLDVVGDINATGALYSANGLFVSGGTVTLPSGEVGNAELANNSLTIASGNGLTDGGVILLGGTATLNIGAGEGILSNADNVSIDTAIVPQKGVDETITGNWTFQNNLRVGGNITYVNSETLNVNGSIIPPLNEWFDIGSITNRWRNISALRMDGGSIYQNLYQVLDKGTSFTGGNITGLWNNLQLVSGSVGSVQLIDGAVNASKLATTIALGSGQTITSGAGTLNASHLNDKVSLYYINESTEFGGNASGNYSNIQLNAGSVGTSQLIDGVITNQKFVPDLNLGWANLTDYPANCSMGQVVTGFNDTQLICTSAGTGEIQGTGTENYLAKFSASKTIINSTVFEESGKVGINTSSPQNTLEVVGTMNVTSGNGALLVNSEGDVWVRI